MLKRSWWWIRHRRTERESLAFSIGVTVGRALCDHDTKLERLARKIEEKP